jgi:hypothetical protein
VGVIGSDGMVGGAGALIDSPAATEATVQVAGSAHWITAEVLRQQAEDDSAVQTVLLRDIKDSHTQIAQLTLCQLHHTVTEQTCRWLLRLHIAAGKKSFLLPEKFAGQMVNAGYIERLETLDALVRAGFVRYEEGCITVLDLEGLESSVCSCHQQLTELQRRHRELKSRFERRRAEFLRLQSAWNNREWKGREDHGNRN